MRWPQDATGWPLTEYSRQILSRPHRWHVQSAGRGDTLLLLHGAGGATHSWRGLFPLLAQTHQVVALDLPGQGFTQLGGRARCGLDHMAEDIAALCRQQGWQPRAIVGHSAGAAVALRLAETGQMPEVQVIGLNAALGHFKGVAGWLFPMMAKLLALTPLTAAMVAGTMTEPAVRKLIRGTGSALDDEGTLCYLRLASDRAHVDATLSMMAQWSLDGLLARLPDLTHQVTLITSAGDLAVPPETSAIAARALPHARLVQLPRLGHLAHEEDPPQFAALIQAALASG